ncbi:hypothetical protein [Streptomyces cyaneofuscatus]|uniref:hypothetical protein n=1 Tax=Streptomyces cyaneofuscatus TaxID=66883 RepID=UPI00364685EC
MTRPPRNRTSTIQRIWLKQATGASQVSRARALGAQAADDAQTCRIQAARCRIELGQHQRALDDLQRELVQLRAHWAPTNTVALEVRLYVGLLLRDMHRFADAARELGSLYNDLVGRRGPASALVDQLREALIGIRRRPLHFDEVSETVQGRTPGPGTEADTEKPDT